MSKYIEKKEEIYLFNLVMKLLFCVFVYCMYVCVCGIGMNGLLIVDSLSKLIKNSRRIVHQQQQYSLSAQNVVRGED